MSSESEAEAEPAVQIVDETKSVTSKSSVGKSPKSLHDTESLQKSQSEGKILKRSDTVKGFRMIFFFKNLTGDIFRKSQIIYGNISVPYKKLYDCMSIFNIISFFSTIS